MPLFIGCTVFLALFILTIAGVITNLTFNLFSVSLVPAQQIVTEVIVLLFWLGLNHFYLRQRVSWRFSFRRWYLVLPVIVVLLGDATLKPHFTFDWAHILWALGLGLAIGVVEEYVFRGLLVNYLATEFRLGAGLTATLSALTFAVVHIANLSDGDLINTVAQVLAACGIGFFFAVIYLITKNLWLPIIGHTLIDSFDQLAFGTLSNTAGTSLVTSSVYAVFFVLLGVYLLRKNRLQPGLRHVTEHQPSFGPHYSNRRLWIDPWKTVLVCLIPPLELLIVPLAIKLVHGQLGRVIIMDLVFLLGFCGALWLYGSVLKADWPRFKRHWLRNSLWAIGGVFVSYAILAAVRLVLKPLAVGSGPDVLSIQPALVSFAASLTVLLAPFTEEIIFRHALFYQWKQRGILTWLMFILSAVLFGLVHWNNFDGNIIAMVPYMAVGAWYALIYYWSHNIWQNIMTHFLFDFIQFLGAVLVLVVTLLQG